MNAKIIGVLFFALLLAGLASAGDLKAMGVSYEPAPAAPGSSITVWVQLKNDSIYKVEEGLIIVKASFPLSLQPGQEAERNLGELSPYQTRTIEYKLLVDAKAVDGDHSIDVIVGEGPSKREYGFTITVSSRTPKLEIVESSTNQLSPGTVQPVMLTVKNIGGSIAKDIVLKVNPERTVTSTGVVVEREIVSLGAVANYISSLEKNEAAEVELTLAVNQDASLKNYSIPVTIEYYDVNGTEKSQTAYLGIKVSAEADVDAVVNSVSPRAFPGGTSEVTIDLFNIGLADARYVVVELAGGGLEIAEPRQFIGTLEADDFDSFKTEIKFDPTVQIGSLPLALRIIYKDEELQERVITKALNVNVASPAEAVGGADPLLGLVGLISLALQLIGLYVVAKWAWPRAKAFRAARKKK